MWILWKNSSSNLNLQFSKITQPIHFFENNPNYIMFNKFCEKSFILNKMKPKILIKRYVQTHVLAKWLKTFITKFLNKCKTIISVTNFLINSIYQVKIFLYRIILQAGAPSWRNVYQVVSQLNPWIGSFFEYFALILSNLGFKMKQIWIPNFWKCRFFKNEALNQKSGTVKVLGYA